MFTITHQASCPTCRGTGIEKGTNRYPAHKCQTCFGARSVLYDNKNRIRLVGQEYWTDRDCLWFEDFEVVDIDRNEAYLPTGEQVWKEELGEI